MTNLSLDSLFVVGENGTLPTFGSTHAACFDIYAAEDTELKALTPTLVSTDLYLSSEANKLSGYYISVVPRSGNSLKGLRILNSPGTVDSDYTGELKIIMSYNAGQGALPFYQIKKGDRIAQGMFVALSECQLNLRQLAHPTEARIGGFGSTGV